MNPGGDLYPRGGEGRKYGDEESGYGYVKNGDNIYVGDIYMT